MYEPGALATVFSYSPLQFPAIAPPHPAKPPIGNPADIVKIRKDCFPTINAGKCAFRPQKARSTRPYSGGTTFLSPRPPRSLKTKYPVVTFETKQSQSASFRSEPPPTTAHRGKMVTNAPFCTEMHRFPPKRPIVALTPYSNSHLAHAP